MPRVGVPDLKEKLLRSGLSCFARKGFQATTMDEIAQEAGVSKGAIYWHYKDKRELFLSIMRERGAALEAAGAEAVEKAREANDLVLLLTAILTAIFGFYAENREFASLLALLRSGKDAPFGEELYRELQEFYRKSRAGFAPLFAFGIQTGVFVECPPEILAVWLLATVDGTVMQWVIDPEHINLLACAPILSGRFLQGIRKLPE